MAKIQKIERKYDTLYFVYIPSIIIEEASLDAGDDLEVECTSKGRITLNKIGSQI